MRKAPPARAVHPPPLRVDPEKYPNLAINPALERALRIRQELEKGRPRDEAVALADQAMGRMAPSQGHRPAAKGKPGPRRATHRKDAAKASRAAPRLRQR